MLPEWHQQQPLDNQRALLRSALGCVHSLEHLTGSLSHHLDGPDVSLCIVQAYLPLLQVVLETTIHELLLLVWQLRSARVRPRLRVIGVDAVHSQNDVHTGGRCRGGPQDPAVIQCSKGP